MIRFAHSKFFASTALLASVMVIAMSGDAAADRNSSQLYVGVSNSAANREDSKKMWVPEVFVQKYKRLDRRLFMRSSARLFYRGSSQGETTQTVSFREHGMGVAADLGIAIDAAVVPSLSLGAAWEVRRLTTDIDVSPDGSGTFDRTDWYSTPGLYWQAGLGFPVAGRGKQLLLEPTVRREYVQNDTVARWRFGFEISWAW